MNDDQYDVWLMNEVLLERQWRQKRGEVDLPDEILAEHVMQALLRDSIYGCSPFIIYCTRRVSSRSPEMLIAYEQFRAGEDASEEFNDQLALEISARVNEILTELNRERRRREKNGE